MIIPLVSLPLFITPILLNMFYFFTFTYLSIHLHKVEGFIRKKEAENLLIQSVHKTLLFPQ